jgi:hypothetical protein
MIWAASQYPDSVNGSVVTLTTRLETGEEKSSMTSSKPPSSAETIETRPELSESSDRSSPVATTRPGSRVTGRGAAAGSAAEAAADEGTGLSTPSGGEQAASDARTTSAAPIPAMPCLARIRCPVLE